MSEVTPKVELLSFTPLPQKQVAMAAKLCYSDSHISELEEQDPAKQEKFIENLVRIGHLSPIEHASFTFGIEGVSRALLAQITRHRIASFSVQSQRYVSKTGGFEYVIPPAISALGAQAKEKYEAQMRMMSDWYDEWVEALGSAGEKSNEDARFVLPNACETRMIITMNARELLHFFSLRCCNRAQWEIREVAWKMLVLCRQAAPAIFKNAGPSCLSGTCSEGTKSCKKMEEVRAFAATLFGNE